MPYEVLQPTNKLHPIIAQATLFEVVLFNGRKLFFRDRGRISVELTDAEAAEQIRLVNEGIPCVAIRPVFDDGSFSREDS